MRSYPPTARCRVPHSCASRMSGLQPPNPTLTLSRPAPFFCLRGRISITTSCSRLRSVRRHTRLVRKLPPPLDNPRHLPIDPARGNPNECRRHQFQLCRKRSARPQTNAAARASAIFRRPAERHRHPEPRSPKRIRQPRRGPRRRQPLNHSSGSAASRVPHSCAASSRMSGLRPPNPTPHPKPPQPPSPAPHPSPRGAP
jgi:hypothetical protein